MRWLRWPQMSMSWPARTWTGCRTRSGPNGSCGSGGWSTDWKASGSKNSPAWMPTAPPAPKKAKRRAQPPGGCATASTSAPARLPARSGRLGPRALFRGPLAATAQAVVDGEVSVAHAQVLAHGTSDLPAHVAVEAEPVLVEAARRLDPPRLRRVLGHLHQVADPEGADRQAERRHQRRGLWLTPTFEGMVAIDDGGSGQSAGPPGRRGR